MSAAIERGISVSVYTDPECNTNDHDPRRVASKREKLLADVEFLRKKGIETIFVGRVHSKAVIGDDNLYCVGSFNWFSASRDSRYTQHETSLVYRGFGLTSEIEIMLKSLKERVTHCRQERRAISPVNPVLPGEVLDRRQRDQRLVAHVDSF